jgi:outer membrane immunogenic protein
MTYRPEMLAASLLALALASPAMAQDVAPPSDWTGLYFGMAVATPQGDNTWRAEAFDDLQLVPGSWTGRTRILTLGHDWQRGGLTFGALVSANTDGFTATPTDAIYLTCDNCQTEVSHLITLRGRAGYVMGDTLFFTSGGIARGDVRATNVTGTLIEAEDSLSGWTLGVGVEHRIGSNLTVAVSYDHVDLGKLDMSDFFASTVSHIKFNQVQVGMNVRW